MDVLDARMSAYECVQTLRNRDTGHPSLKRTEYRFSWQESGRTSGKERPLSGFANSETGCVDGALVGSYT